MLKHQDAKIRLKTIEGHIRGIQRMIEEEAYCVDIISQIHAVQSALNKVSTMILEDHLHTCLISAVQGDNIEERERVLQEIIDVFDAAAKV